MKWIDNLKTGVKLFIGFGVTVALMILIAVVGYIGVQDMSNGMNSMYTDRTLPIQQVGVANTYLFTLRGDVYKFIYISEERNLSRPAMVTDRAKIKEQMDLYRAASSLTTEEKGYLSDFDKAYAIYTQHIDTAIANVDSGKLELAVKSIMDGGDVANARKAVGAAMDKIIALNSSIAKQINQDGQQTFTTMRNLLFGAAALGVILAVLFGFVITRSITLPLGMVVKMSQALQVGDLLRGMSDAEKDKLRRRGDEIGEVGKALDGVIDYLQETGNAAAIIADNDLTVSIEQKSQQDELRGAFIRMVSSLRDSLSEVSESATNLGSSSAQLSSAANQAGQATSQIATTIQQVTKGITQETESITRTSGSIDQMTRAIDGVAKGAQEQAHAAQKASVITGQISNSIQQVSKNAQSVTQEAGRAAVSAQDGADKVRMTLKGMESIRAKVGLSAEKVAQMGRHSEQITVIVETIEDIASQTNLLALNAAIEAARAGEHGKGFAVVAEEVRKLAERASSSTKEIGELIKGIQRTVNEAVSAMNDGTREVENGVLQANEAGAALESILKSTEAVTHEAQQAAKAMQEMNNAAAELVSAVDSVSAVVEENTASTEQMAAGSTEVTQAMENIASVSEQNSAAVEQVSAGTEEMSAQVEEVSASAQALEEMAQNLKDLVGRFKLEGDQGGGQPRRAAEQKLRRR